MKKIVSALLVVMLVFGMLPVIASAAEETATITFDNVSKRTVFNTSQQVWVENGITVTNNKGSSTSNVANYSNPARFYKSSQLIIEYPDMTQIVFDCNSSSYASALKSSLTSGTYASATVSSDKVTVTFAEPQSSFTIAKLTGGQVRMDGLTVTAQAGETVECDHPTSTVQDDAVAPTCTTVGYTASEKCDTCGATTKYAEEIPALGHSYVDGYCAACQEWEAGMTLTISQATAMGLAKGHNNYTAGKYYMTVTITEVYGDTYGNMYVTDESGEKFTIYGLYSEDGNTRYDAMETKPVAGDVITVYGIIGAYNNAAQMKNGWLISIDGGDSSCEHATTNVISGNAPTCTETGLTEGQVCADCGETIVAQEVIPALGHNYDEDGECTECGEIQGEIASVATITFDDTAKRTTFTDSQQVWTENNITVTNNQASSTSKMADYAAPVRFYKSTELIIAYPGMGKIEFACNTAAYATALQDSLTDGTYASVTVADKVVTVIFAEAVDSYTINLTGGQVRMDSLTVTVKVEGCEHNSVAQDDAVAPTCTTVGYTATEKCSICGETTKYAEEIPALGHSYVDGFCSACQEWEADMTITIPQASAMGLAKDHNTYTAGRYYMTVTVAEVSNTTYGNMNVTDAEGNTFVIYGTYSADGNLSYSKMETKPVAGDTITVYGIIGQYNGTAQMKNGWIISWTTPVCEHTNTTEQADGKAATCTETGLTNSWTCDACGETVIAQEVIPVTEHAWDDGVYTDPTTEADGYTTYTCGTCGATEVEVDEGTMLPPAVVNAIVKHPENITAESGETVQFKVEATGDIVSYKWEYRKVYKWFNTSMEGCETDTLTVPVTGARNGYDYRCTVTFADGTQIISEAAELTVPSTIVITDDPNDQTVALGYKGQFTALAEGESIRYAWQYKRPGEENWHYTEMEGYTKPTVLIETTVARDGYMYRCEIKDATGAVAYTEAATLTVLSYTTQPADVRTNVDANVTFTVETNASVVRYEWQYSKDGVKWFNTTMTGYNTAALTVTATAARDGYMYRCVVTGDKDSKLTSKVATLYVGETAVITAQPQSVTAAVGTTAAFTVTAENVHAYQWQYTKNGTDWYTTSMDGATTATLNVAVVAARNGYQYRCQITATNGDVIYTDAATLTVG